MTSNLPARRYRRCVYKAAEQNSLTQGVQSADCGIMCVPTPVSKVRARQVCMQQVFT